MDTKPSIVIQQSEVEDVLKEITMIVLTYRYTYNLARDRLARMTNNIKQYMTGVTAALVVSIASGHLVNHLHPFMIFLNPGIRSGLISVNPNSLFLGTSIF